MSARLYNLIHVHRPCITSIPLIFRELGELKQKFAE